MADPFSFTQSRAVRGYNPQFFNAEPQAGMPVDGGATSPDLTNRLLQVLGGNLGGTLTGGEKLSALGALLKSVSRGSQTSPQQVMQGLQQQKLQEVQGALQVQQLRKAAMEQANVSQIRERLMAGAKTEGDRDRIRLLDDASLQQFALKGLEEKTPEMEGKRKQFEEYYRIYDEQGPSAASVYWKLIAPGQVVGSIETGLKIVDTPEPPKRSTITAPSAATATDGSTPKRTITELAPPQPKPVVPTESENQAAYLFTRLQNSLNNLKIISAKDASAAIPSGTEIATQSILGEDVANKFKSPERQQYISSRRDALGAALTLATGAAYTPLELDAQERSYFPQYGDDPETIKFKQNQWSVLLDAAKKKAGRAVQPTPSQPQSGGQRPASSKIKILSVKPRG